MSTGTLLPQARAVFTYPTGAPLAAGYVYTYVPGGTTPKTTYKDAACTIANTNPIVLDAAGSCLLYGSGNFQITVTDGFGNAIPGYSGVTSDALTAIAAATVMGPFLQSSTTAGGLSQINYLSALSGASARTVQSKLSDTVSLADFGAVGTGNATVDTAALNAALAALPSAGGAIFIPPGSYNFSSQITYTMPSSTATITLFGAGSGVTTLTWASGGGISFTCAGAYNCFHIRGMSFFTGLAGGGTTGLAITQTTADASPAYTPMSDLNDVAFRGSDTWGGTYYWGTAINITGLSNVVFYNVNICGYAGSYATLGTGVKISGTSTTPPVVFNFNNCAINLVGTGIVYGNYVQAICLNQTNITGVNYGVYAATSESALDQLVLTGSQINAATAGINAISFIPSVTVTASTFIIPNASSIGIQLNNPGLTAITGNSFQGGSITGTYGVALIGTSQGAAVISGNSFNLLATGISIGASVTLVNVQSNCYNGVTTHVVNSGSGNTIGGGST